MVVAGTYNFGEYNMGYHHINNNISVVENRDCGKKTKTKTVAVTLASTSTVYKIKSALGLQ
jgi:hypothetical protein